MLERARREEIFYVLVLPKVFKSKFNEFHAKRFIDYLIKRNMIFNR